MQGNQSAYTMFEIMLGLAIVSILAAISIPGLSLVIANHHERMLQSQLLDAIQMARQEADIRGLPVSLCKSRDGESCHGAWSDGLLVFMDEQNDGVVHDKQQLLSFTQLNTHHGTLSWRAYPYYRHHLRFMPAKQLSADNGMFWYCKGTNTAPAFAVTISRLGMIRVVYPDHQGEIKDSRGRLIRC